MRQKLAEQFGTSTKTVDLELEKRIASVRLDYEECQNMLKLIKQLAAQTTNVVQAQTSISTCFERMTRSNTPLHSEFTVGQNLFDIMANSALIVVSSLTTFADELAGLIKREYEPLWPLLRRYDSLRLDYDVCRLELESTRTSNVPRSNVAELKFIESQANFTAIGNDVSIRLAHIEKIGRAHV